VVFAVTLALFTGTQLFRSRHLARRVSSGPDALRDLETGGKIPHYIGIDRSNLSTCPVALGAVVSYSVDRSVGDIDRVRLWFHVAVTARVSAPKPCPTAFRTGVDIDVGADWRAPSLLQIPTTCGTFKFRLGSIESQPQSHATYVRLDFTARI